MKIKHFDEILQKWIIDGASNAVDLELSNPAFLSNEGNSISISQGFTKLYNKIQKLENNLAWIYINGAHGGTGGGGGESGNITIQIDGGNTVYTSSSTVKFNLLINNGTISKPFTIVIKNTVTGKIIYTEKKYSLSWIQITLSGITENTDYEITAYDSLSNYAVPQYLHVIYGAIRIETQSNIPKTIIIGSTSQIPLVIDITNNITGAVTYFKFSVNNIVIDEQSNITTQQKSLRYDLKDILLGNIFFSNIRTGQKFNFTAYASTILNGTELKSNILTFSITIADSNSLIIVTDGISEDYTSLTEISKGSQLSFTYYLSYAPTKYTTFNIIYNIYLEENGEKIGNSLLSGTISNINKGTNNTFSISTVSFDVNNNLLIELYAYAISSPDDSTAQYTKQVYAKITEAVKIDLYADNTNKNLLAYYSKVTGFPQSSNTSWKYPISNTGIFAYEGSFASQFNGSVDLYLKKTNGISTGFINDTDGEKTPGIVLKNGSYAYIDVANQMFPNYDINNFGFFSTTFGFNISCTFKGSGGTVMNIARYKDDSLDSGIEITTTKATVKIGAAGSISVDLPEDELLTIDIDVSLINKQPGKEAWYFKIYINGVLSAVTRVAQSDIDWMFGQNLFFGCKNNNGILSDFSNIIIYDIKLYTSSQSEYSIVKNYISAREQALLINGYVSESLDNELRTKNLFDSSGDCFIWNKTKQAFYDGQELYDKLVSQIEVNTPYPIVMIEETSINRTDFKAYSTAIFTAEEKDKIMNATFPCTIRFQNKLGSVLIKTPSNVGASNGVRIGLQGTSSLSYNAKNYELYLGDMDETGKKQLFMPIPEWLPENEFTLKADVMDSAHVNNVVIGKIINGEVKNANGVQVMPLEPTPPMKLPASLFPSTEKYEEIVSKIKHTSDGFPCLLFIKFAPESENDIAETRFMGIYNFNLGRYALFNLGLKILTDFTKVTEGGGPTLISDYIEIEDYWNTSTTGTYSLEVNQNNSAQGAFQQDDMAIIKFMLDVPYTSKDKDSAYQAVQKLYYQLARMPLKSTQRYTMDDLGQTPTKPIPGETYEYNSAYYNFSAFDSRMNWNNAVGYFMIAMIFGMVDSMCKNLTLRSWGGNIWYTTFYDMDTAFKLNNAGQDIVAYWAHLHRWYNVPANDTGVTTFTSELNYSSNENIRQYFASNWNRIWEVLENLPLKDSGNISDRMILENKYADLRLNLFSDPEKFIKDYYEAYTDQTGAILFNYDYKVKYLKIAQTYDSVTNAYIDSTDFTQLKFLHGNRVISVKDWFKKRIFFLDGVYGYSKGKNYLRDTIKSPVNQKWNKNKAVGSQSQPLLTVTMSTISKMLYRWSYDKTSGSFWLDENSTDAVVPVTGGETIVDIYANNYITQFIHFKDYFWTALTNIDLPLLKELDLSNLSNIPANDFLAYGVYDKETNAGLKNIEKLILHNVHFANNAVYTLDVSECDHLYYLDISNSGITNVILNDNASLKTFNLSNTNITTLELNNQAFLENLDITGCANLTNVKIINCNSLLSLNIPNNVKTVEIISCNSLNSIRIPYTSIDNSISPLIEINIDNCPSLKEFNIANQNNPGLVVNLIGAINLETLNISGTKISKLTFPVLFDGNNNPVFTSLRDIDISNTTISSFTYGDQQYNYLELSYFTNLSRINCSNCRNLTKVKCSNIPNHYINLEYNSFYNCTSLRRVIGNFNITGYAVFKNCSQFILNELTTYQIYGTNFITDANGTNIKFDDGLSNLLEMFSDCGSLSYDDFNYIKLRLHQNITSIEGMFRNCWNINGNIQYDLFRNCRRINVIKEAFSNTGLSGIFYSRSNDYDKNNDFTWGILDFVPNLMNAESAFSGTKIEWIDNKVFSSYYDGTKTVFPSLVNIDNMFRGCTSLKSCVDTRNLVNGAPEEGNLNSETFFVDLINLNTIYPSNVFAGCIHINMDIISYDNNTLLFHTSKNISDAVIDNTLYNGINLIGEIKNNVFGGINNVIVKDNKTYYIPVFTSIKSPFDTGASNNAKIRISEMGSLFKNINTSIRQAIGIFRGLKVHEEDSGIIPADIFKGCINLISIESFFSGLNLTNGGNSYVFPATYIDDGVTKGMFDDCVNLKITKNLFYGCNQLKIKLVGEGFKNCKLEDVSGMFSNSGLYDVIPYRLFFMVNNNKLQRTIKTMDNIFSGCWCLGYDITRSVAIGRQIYGRKTTWSDGIIDNPGNKVFFKLDVTNLKKSYNYNRDENQYIPLTATNYDITEKYILNNGTYVLYDISNIQFYKYSIDGYTPYNYNGYSNEEVYVKENDQYIRYIVPDLYVKNIRYNPGEYAFDDWYLDGYGWEGAHSNEPVLNDGTDLQDVIERLTPDYFYYDSLQKAVLNQSDITRYKTAYQNYMIPTDLFRYCSSDATLINVLNNLTWKRKIITTDEYGRDIITETNEINGLTGRIPARLLEDLVDNKTFDSTFKNTTFDAYVGLNADIIDSNGNMQRGIMFPPDLLRYNIAIENLPSLFSEIEIYTGVDINADLFDGLPNLKNISKMFSNTKFNNLHYIGEPFTGSSVSQINFNMFKYNTKLMNVSSLFAFTLLTVDDYRGLYVVQQSLFNNNYNINSINSMFYNNYLMVGSVPTFDKNIYKLLVDYSDYLFGVPKSNITNADNVREELKPNSWKQ